MPPEPPPSSCGRTTAISCAWTSETSTASSRVLRPIPCCWRRTCREAAPAASHRLRGAVGTAASTPAAKTLPGLGPAAPQGPGGTETDWVVPRETSLQPQAAPCSSHTRPIASL
uniref:Uncharacterized protein n=1 Tax=Terrapene triunguis TaxID=2587831 RepID=A0A674JXW8_9SAUR